MLTETDRSSSVVWVPHQDDPEVARMHAAAAAGEYRHYADADRVRELHPPLRGPDYVRMRWPRHEHLDLPDARDPLRQLHHARRAIERARTRAGLLADLQTWPTAEERVATVRDNARRARVRARTTRAEELLHVRHRLRELPVGLRRAVILAWNSRRLPGDHLPGFIDRFLRGEVAPAPELLLPADLLILGCTPHRDPTPARLPANRRFLGHTIGLASGGALLGRGLAVVILTAELGLLHCWESERCGRLLGPVGPALNPERAAELADDPTAAAGFLHAILVGPGNEERPPYRHVLIGGSPLHQAVVESWERAGVFRGASLNYLPADDGAQRDAIAALYRLTPEAEPRGPHQLELL